MHKPDEIDNIFSDMLSKYRAMDAIVDQLDGSDKITYEDLSKIVRKLAYYIENNTEKNSTIAILLPKNRYFYATELACLYAGRIFCPFDCEIPTERLSYCLNDLKPSMIVCDKELNFSEIDFDLQVQLPKNMMGDELVSPISSEDAYVIYTSGSTGLPKGVLVPRAALSKFLSWSKEFFNIEPGDRWAQFSNSAFDLSLVDLFTCLSSGGVLVPVRTAYDRMFIGKFVRNHAINIWHSVPSAITLLLPGSIQDAENLVSLKVASFCGEPLYPSQAMSLLGNVPNIKIVNTYGPTEATLFCTFQIVNQELCSATTGGSLPIGQPIPGWHLIFDKQKGELEELIIVSEYLSKGYISETPDQENFEFSEEHQKFTYKTGDLVKREGKNVFFSQRKDRQIKIRGNRLDLSELDYNALTFGASETRSIFYKNNIYLFVSGIGKDQLAKLKEFLRNTIPKHSLPSDILTLDLLPKNTNGKIDNNELRKFVDEKWGYSNGK